MPTELKTARLIVLIDPTSKQAFEVACRDAEMTPSQVVRRLVREFVSANAPPRAARPRKRVR